MVSRPDGISKTVPRRYKCGGTVWTGGPATANELFMSKDELIIQLVKVALGILIGGYFLWWSLEVLKRLPPPH
jgi:hypothetical protein